jgi:hypothetical protein
VVSAFPEQRRKTSAVAEITDQQFSRTTGFIDQDRAVLLMRLKGDSVKQIHGKRRPKDSSCIGAEEPGYGCRAFIAVSRNQFTNERAAIDRACRQECRDGDRQQPVMSCQCVGVTIDNRKKAARMLVARYGVVEDRAQLFSEDLQPVTKVPLL